MSTEVIVFKSFSDLSNKDPMEQDAEKLINPKAIEYKKSFLVYTGIWRPQFSVH